MGGIVSTLFGGSKNKNQSSSTSDNQAYNYLQGALSPMVSGGVTGYNSLADFLGINGSAGTDRANQGLTNYMGSTGFNNLLDSTTRAITGNQAAKGLLRSGATGEAITNNSQQLAQQSAQNYLGNLASLSQLGLGAAGTIAGAGQRSNSQSSGSGSSNNGIFSAIPIFSDRRLKRNITRIGYINGLPIYRYRYVWSPLYTIGVMAQDVAAVQPEALGPKIFGFMTVRYDVLFATTEA